MKFGEGNDSNTFAGDIHTPVNLVHVEFKLRSKVTISAGELIDGAGEVTMQGNLAWIPKGGLSV